MEHEEFHLRFETFIDIDKSQVRIRVRFLNFFIKSYKVVATDTRQIITHIDQLLGK